MFRNNFQQKNVEKKISKKSSETFFKQKKFSKTKWPYLYIKNSTKIAKLKYQNVVK